MNRREQLDRLADATEKWDVIVVGGGATGLGIALDAANRGYRTALLEQADFSEGTSSKSTKLIHGGVRYLRGGEIGLVRESLRERGRLLRNARGLVEPLPFVVPAFRWYERLYYGTGLTLYDFLAGELGIRSTGHLSAAETASRVPGLNDDGLYGATLYWDGQFDDARLALALARTAVEEGAAVVNHVRVEELVKEAGRVTGVVARDRVDEREFRLEGRVVVNATGVFSDEVRRMDEPDVEGLILPSQGIHLVLDREFLRSDTAVMIPRTDDGRVLFAIPWRERLLIGTTDTADVPAELHPRPRAEEVDYLLEHAGRYLRRPPERGDVRAVFTGLRPLVKFSSSVGSTAKVSRSHEILVSDAGLVTVAGGKWTTYRQMAEDAVDRLAGLAGLPGQPCATADLTLSTGANDSLDLQEEKPLDPGLPLTEEAVRRAVVEEMALSIDDVLSRRTRSLVLDAAAAERVAPEVARSMAEELGRNGEWIEEELASFAELAADHRPPTSHKPSDVESEGS